MSRCLGYFNKGNDKKLTVLVATSGDTGGAVANGFENIEGIEVIILYPSGKVSPVQELQLTTCASNISALEIDGSFDDCQAMVKQAFMDEDIKALWQLTSANSINVARWLPQQLYYCFALQQWQHDEPPIISVPSGNFGNICAGMIAHASGLPIKHFIAACNANDTIPSFLHSGKMKDQKSISTISNAMDVANPSNFVRIMEMYDQELKSLKKNLSGISISDDTTKQTIKDVFDASGYILDPHGAVGYRALDDYLERYGGKGIFLETAHPVKFPAVVEEVIGQQLDIPEEVKHLYAREKKSTKMNAGFPALKEWMLS
jgi:threonine synthase